MDAKEKVKEQCGMLEGERVKIGEEVCEKSMVTI